jgi:Tol biopolymer transport system component
MPSTFKPCFLLVFTLILSSCSVEIPQTVEAVSSPGIENTVSPSSSPYPMTHVPITWSLLNLRGKLVYISSTDKENSITGTIQMLDLVTGDITTIFRVPGAWIYYATISPDAKWLVISYSPPAERNSSPNRALYILPLDETNPPQILITPPTPDEHYTQAEWSPDGKYIYYVHYNHADTRGQFYEAYEIFRMAYPGSTPEKILDYAFWPRLSADSANLVYTSLDPTSGKNELFLANADGSHPQVVRFSGFWIPDIIDAPIFSPDGQSILFSAPGPGQSYQPNWIEKLMGIQVARAHNVPSDWWSVPVSGGVPTRLTHLQTINLFASISLDQKHIASLSGEGIFVMDLDGSNLTQLVSDSGVHGTVSWIP